MLSLRQLKGGATLNDISRTLAGSTEDKIVTAKIASDLSLKFDTRHRIQRSDMSTSASNGDIPTALVIKNYFDTVNGYTLNRAGTIGGIQTLHTSGRNQTSVFRLVVDDTAADLGPYRGIVLLMLKTNDTAYTAITSASKSIDFVLTEMYRGTTTNWTISFSISVLYTTLSGTTPQQFIGASVRTYDGQSPTTPLLAIEGKTSTGATTTVPYKLYQIR